MATEARRRVERPLLGGRVTYVETNVFNVYDALLHTIARDEESGSSSSSDSSLAPSSLLSSSLLSFSSSSAVITEEPPPRPRQVLVPAKIGSSDRYADLFGLLSVRDGILLLSVLQGFALGTYQLIHAFLIKPFLWQSLGQLLFGLNNLGVGLLLVACALVPRLWLIHLAETCSTAVILALTMEFCTTLVRFFVLGLRANEWFWSSLLKAVAINLSLAIFYWLYGRGLFASFRSIHVAGGSGTEHLTWFQLLQNA